MFVTRRSKNSLFFVFDSLSNLDCDQWYTFWIYQSHLMRVPWGHKVLTHGQEPLFRKVTSVTIHSFVEWLDTFSYVLRPEDVTLQKILYSISIVLLWNTCASCNWRQHLQRLSPHGLHWPTGDEGLDTAAQTRVSLKLLGRRNATTSGSGNNMASFHFFQFLSNDDGQCLEFSLKRVGKWEQGEPLISVNFTDLWKPTL
jgi:hypothetical protein